MCVLKLNLNLFRDNILNATYTHILLLIFLCFLVPYTASKMAQGVPGLLHVREQTGLKEFGRCITVADNPRAKLMYYLHSVTNVITLDDADVRRLRNYGNYASLTDDDTRTLLAIVVLLSPDELMDKVFFQSDELCGMYDNKFFEVKQVSHVLAITGNVVIGGERKRVNKIMTFRKSWLRENYLEPLQQLRYLVAPADEKKKDKSSCSIL